MFDFLKRKAVLLFVNQFIDLLVTMAIDWLRKNWKDNKDAIRDRIFQAFNNEYLSKRATPAELTKWNAATDNLLVSKEFDSWAKATEDIATM